MLGTRPTLTLVALGVVVIVLAGCGDDVEPAADPVLTLAPTTISVVPALVTTTTVAPSPPTVAEAAPVAFLSPSGNITCVMTSESGASCYIFEKQWEIDAPPGCEGMDWGNAIDVDATGATTFPCYTDFIWSTDGPVLAYGSSREVGSVRCDSAETGVTCRHSGGAGFMISRASGAMLSP